MNERIKELVKQAGGHFSTHTLTSYPAQRRESIELWDNNIEKFAELIVRECANRLAEDFIPEDEIIEGYNDTWDSALRFGAQAIKEHFGVEEK